MLIGAKTEIELGIVIPYDSGLTFSSIHFGI